MEACLNSFRQTGTRSYSLSVTARSVCLYQSGSPGGQGHSWGKSDLLPCASMSFSPQKGRHRNHADWTPRSLLQTQPLPQLQWEKNVADFKPVSSLSIGQRPPLTHVMGKIRLQHVLALEGSVAENPQKTCMNGI